MEIETTSFDTEGLATAMPPTALVTETAAVRTPSAMVKLVPNSAQISMGQRKDGGGLMSLRLTFPAIKESWVGVLSKYFGGYMPWNKANVPPSPS
jgi:hypothetical protein